MKQKTEEQRKGDYDYEVKVYENAKPGTMVLKVSSLLLKQPVVKTTTNWTIVFVACVISKILIRPTYCLNLTFIAYFEFIISVVTDINMN